MKSLEVEVPDNVSREEMQRNIQRIYGSASTELRQEIESTKEEVEKASKIDALVAKAAHDVIEKQQEHYSGAAMQEQSLASRVNGIHNFLRAFNQYEGSDTQGVNQEISKVENSLEEFREKYIKRKTQYNPLIPKHFTTLCEKLIEHAKNSQENKEREIGYTHSAELLLQKIEDMYGSRTIQQQLVDMQHFRSGNYELVKKD